MKLPDKKDTENISKEIEETENKYSQAIEKHEPLDVIKTILAHIHYLEKQLVKLKNKE